MPKLSARAVGLRPLITDLKKVPQQTTEQADRIVRRSVGAIERSWKARWARIGPHLPHIANSITSEFHVSADVVSGETGPTKGHPQGRLGSFIEFGTRTSGPHPGGWPACDAEEPNFARAVEDIRLDILR